MVVVLKYLGEEKERERIPLWNGDRASDGLVHSIPENLSVFILALGISLEILHTHTHTSFPIWIFFIEPYLSIFVSPLSFSLTRLRFRSNFITRKISLLLLFLFSFPLFSRETIDNTSPGLYRVETYSVMDTKGLMGIDIHVQYRKIIKLGRNRRIHFTIPRLLLFFFSVHEWICILHVLARSSSIVPH